MRTKRVLKCRACGCLWREWEDSSQSLLDGEQKSCKLCDNAPSPPLDEARFGNECGARKVEVNISLADGADIRSMADELLRMLREGLPPEDA